MGLWKSRWSRCSSLPSVLDWHYKVPGGGGFGCRLVNLIRGFKQPQNVQDLLVFSSVRFPRKLQVLETWPGKMKDWKLLLCLSFMYSILKYCLMCMELKMGKPDFTGQEQASTDSS